MENDVDPTSRSPRHRERNLNLDTSSCLTNEQKSVRSSKITSPTSPNVKSAIYGSRYSPESRKNGIIQHLGILRQANGVQSQHSAPEVVLLTSEPKSTIPSPRSPEIGSVDYSLWTARTHLKPARSILTSSENRYFTTNKTLDLQNRSIVGKPSVKNLMRRFDTNYGDQTASTVKSCDRKSPMLKGEVQSEGIDKANQKDSILNTERVSYTNLPYQFITKDCKSRRDEILEPKSKFLNHSNHSNTNRNLAGLSYTESESINSKNPKFKLSQTSLTSQTRLFGEICRPENPISENTSERARRARRTSDPDTLPSRSDPKNSTSYLPKWNWEKFNLNDSSTNCHKTHNRNHSDLVDTKVNTMLNLSMKSSTPVYNLNSSSVSSKLINSKSIMEDSSSSIISSKKATSKSPSRTACHTDNNQYLPRDKTRVMHSLASNKCRLSVDFPASSKVTSNFQVSQLHASSTNIILSSMNNSIQNQDLDISLIKSGEEKGKQKIQDSNLEDMCPVAQPEPRHKSCNYRSKSIKQSRVLSNKFQMSTANGTTKFNDFGTDQTDLPIPPPALTPSESKENDVSDPKLKECNNLQDNLLNLGVPGSYIDDDETSTDTFDRREKIRSDESDTCLKNSKFDRSIPSDKVRPNGKSSTKHGKSDGSEMRNNTLVIESKKISDEYNSGCQCSEKYPISLGVFEKEDALLLNRSSKMSLPKLQAPETSKFSETTLQSVPINDSRRLDCDRNDVDNVSSESRIDVSNKIRNEVPRTDVDEFQTTLTDMYYEASENGVIDSENRSAMSSQEIFSKHSSWQTDLSIGIDNDFLGRSNSIMDHKYAPNSDDERPRPLAKTPRILPVVPSKPSGHGLKPSCIQSINVSPQLPPVAIGEGFSLVFSRNDTSDTGIASIKGSSFEYVLSPLDFHKLDSSSTRRSSSLISNQSRPHSSMNSQISKPRNSSEEFHHQKASTLRTYLQSKLNSKKDITLGDSGITTGGQSEIGDELRVREENRKRLYQRKMAIKELIDTEAVYFKDMNVVEEIYKGTAEACPNLEAIDIKTIFRNTEEIVSFSNTFLEDLKLAALPIYSPRGRKTKTSGSDTSTSLSELDKLSVETTLSDEAEEQRDRETYIGASFSKHLPNMQVIYTNFLKNSESASSRLLDLQKDPSVKVWLSECNTVAKDLTAAWDLDALLVKPVQRITRYQLLLKQIQTSTPETHPDSEALLNCCQELSKLLKDIDDLKKRIHMVAKIVGRKRKESDVVRIGIAKAFGRRTEKLTSDKINSNVNKSKDDEDYLKISERFGDDYLRLQVFLRETEYYTRQVSIYVTDYLRFLSSIELIMRMSPTGYPEIESKWAGFNVSMREIGTRFVEDHIYEIRKFVIEPFEKTISAYNGPLLAMKKRDKRKVDFDKTMTLKAQGKKIDEKLQNLSNEYSALHETLKWELPKLSKLTENMGKVILGRLIYIQAKWHGIWMQKVQKVLEDNELPKDICDIVEQFKSDFKFEESRLTELGIVNGSFGFEPSQRGNRSRSHSRRISDVGNFSQLAQIDSTHVKRSSATFNCNRSQKSSNLQSPNNVNNAAVIETQIQRTPSSPAGRTSARSFTSETCLRGSSDYNTYRRRESVSTYGSYQDGHTHSTRPFSGVFHSSPPGENAENIQSRGSSGDQNVSRGYTILYLAASLFEFNINATKKEAGYPYLTYQAGEIFDVIGEKGELWLAKNQDDTNDTVGWIWSKHFARLAAN